MGLFRSIRGKYFSIEVNCSFRRTWLGFWVGDHLDFGMNGGRMKEIRDSVISLDLDGNLIGFRNYSSSKEA